jgi:hypothetical protein
MEAIESHFCKDLRDGVMTNNINPLLISVILLNFLDELNKTYNIFEFRTQ